MSGQVWALSYNCIIKDHLHSSPWDLCPIIYWKWILWMIYHFWSHFSFRQNVFLFWYIYLLKSLWFFLLFKVTHVSIVLVTKDFNPEKYEILCRILLRKYRKSGNPASLLESYLSVLTRGSCSTEENGRFSVQDYDVKRSYANTKLKGSMWLY